MKKFLVVAFLLLTTTVHAQIAFDAGVYGGNVTATSQTVSFTTSGTNRFLMVCAVGDVTPSDVLTTATYNGTSMTLAGKQGISGTRYHYLWTLINPTVGTHNVVVSASGSTFMQTEVASWTGVRQTTNPDVFAAADLTGTQIPMSLTTLVNNAWTILCVGTNGGVSNGPLNFTPRVTDTDFGGIVIGDYGPISPAGSTTMTTFANANNSGLMISIAPLASACSGLLLRGVGC